MSDFIRLRHSMDVSPLLTELSINDDWHTDTYRQTFMKIFKDTLNIPLTEKLTRHVGPRPPMKPTPLYGKYHRAHDFFREFERCYGGSIINAVFTFLRVGGRVPPHIDLHEFFRHHDRFHLVIKGRYTMSTHAQTIRGVAGDLWWCNNDVEHWSENDGTEERIALIFDARDSSWRSRGTAAAP